MFAVTSLSAVNENKQTNITRESQLLLTKPTLPLTTQIVRLETVRNPKLDPLLFANHANSQWIIQPAERHLQYVRIQPELPVRQALS